MPRKRLLALSRGNVPDCVSVCPDISNAPDTLDKQALWGSVDDVVAASKQAIDDAWAGGGFILPTGD